MESSKRYIASYSIGNACGKVRFDSIESKKIEYAKLFASYDNPEIKAKDIKILNINEYNGLHPLSGHR